MTSLSARNVYLIYTGATAFLFTLMFTVSGVYYIQTANLNPLQLVLVGTVLEMSSFLFEIPTGVIADLRSRKLSVLIGLVLIGLGFLIEGSLPIFMFILLSQFLWGVGHTFLSGADEAWIADELNDDILLDKTFLKGAQISQLLSFIGIIVSALLGSIMINLPMILSGIFFIILSLLLIKLMPENNFHKAPKDDRETYKKMWDTFSNGVSHIKGNTLLVSIVFISLLYGLYSEGFDRLWSAHFLVTFNLEDIGPFKPVIWFGIINSISMLLSIISVEYIKRKLDKNKKLSNVWILLIINTLMVLAMVGFSLAGNFTLAFIAYLCKYILRSTNRPLYRAWINKNIKSNVRATVLSTFGQLDALGQIIGGPILGLIALKASIPTAIFVSSLILSPVIILFIIANKKISLSKIN